MSPMAGCRGQATVEAALLVPVVGALMALMLEPCCVLYTRSVMYEAASEAARVAATASDDDLEEVVTSYVRRRLTAVPEVPLFHVGGRSDWQVSASRLDEGATVEVSVTGHIRPLPIAGVAFSLLGDVDGSGVVVEASVRERVRQEWVEDDYETWIKVWE